MLRIPLFNLKKIFLFILFSLFLIVLKASAQISEMINELETVGGLSYGPPEDIRIVIAKIIQNILAFLGIIALILVLYGGFLWMTAGGNEEKIGKAKKILVNASIGVAIILAGYSITVFVINQLSKITLK